LIDSLFQVQSGLNGLEGGAPFIMGWLCHILEDNPASTAILEKKIYKKNWKKKMKFFFYLIFHKLLSMFTFLVRIFLEVFGKSKESNVITGKVEAL
jgi:hypothetical protein